MQLGAHFHRFVNSFVFTYDKLVIADIWEHGKIPMS